MNQYQNTLKLIEKKFNHPPQPFSTGLRLRDTRVKQNKTLESISSDICTPSTLSKIELGVINPNPKLLQMLFNRLKIDDLSNTQQTLNPYDWIDLFEPTLLQGNRIQLKALYQTEMEFYHYQSLLKHFIIHLTLSHLDPVSTLYEQLLQFQIYMSFEECILFYHYTGVYHLKLNNPKLAIKYYQLAYKLAQKFKIHPPLLCLHLAQYYFSLNHSIHGVYHLNDAIRGFSSQYLVKYTLECELLLCEDYIKNNAFFKAKPLLSKLYQQLKLDDYYGYLTRLTYLMGDYHLRLQEYDQAERLYKEALSQSSSIYIPLLKLLHLYHQSDQKLKLTSSIQKIKSIPSLPEILQSQLTYYDFLIHGPSSESFRIFLQKKAIPMAFKHADYHHVELYHVALINLYLEKGKYKLAFQVRNKLNQYQDSHLVS